MALRRGTNPGIVLVCALGLAMALPAAGIAGGGKLRDAVVPSDLLSQAQANPDQLFHVIVQGGDGASSGAVAQDVATANVKLSPSGRANRVCQLIYLPLL